MTQFPYEKRDWNILSKHSEFKQPLPHKPQNSVAELIHNGIVLVDKPQGPTSHQVSAYTRDILELKTCGHSGTLDPNVTGVLPVALDKATKVLQALLLAGKEYVCLLHLHKAVDEKTIRKVCAQYVGVIEQMPPVKSAIKRELRKREIYYIDILEIQDQDVLFRVGCQAGTYIRKLCTDMGDDIGCGAHMQQLVRTRVANFQYENRVTLQELTDAYYYYTEKNDDSLLKTMIHPIEDAVAHLPKIWVHDGAISPICHGAQLTIPGILQLNINIKKNETVAILNTKGELVSLATSLHSATDLYEKQNGVACKTLRVILNGQKYVESKK